MPPRKSSKTAHVLNLLTGSKNSDTSEQDNEINTLVSEKKSAKSEISVNENTEKKESAAEKKPEKAVPKRRRTATTSESTSEIATAENEASKSEYSADGTPEISVDVSVDVSMPQQTVNTEEKAGIQPSDESTANQTLHIDTNELTSEILPDLSEDRLPINTPTEKMASDIAEILSENSNIDIPEMQTINPVMEKMRELNQAPPVIHSDDSHAQSKAEAPEKETQYHEYGPFSYVPPKSDVIPTPMSKSALASMLIAQRKDEEKKTPPPEPEITEETAVYENEDMTLVNLTERAAAKRIPNVMKRFNMCTCERCYYDVLALTLNGIPQKTVIIPKADIERKIKEYELDSTVDLITAISKSCVHVKISPRH